MVFNLGYHYKPNIKIVSEYHAWLIIFYIPNLKVYTYD